jgi:hypothetical protein
MHWLATPSIGRAYSSMLRGTDRVRARACVLGAACARTVRPAPLLLATVLALPVGAAAQAQPGVPVIIVDSVAGPPQRLLTVQPRRTLAELGLVYGTAVGLYYFDGREHQNDRDFSEAFRAIVSPDRWRFDDNEFTMNNVAHPVGGILYYGLPRANGASAGTSFLALLGASVFWEQVVEMREVASINDHIATPLSGWVLGETLFQTRQFFRRGEATRTNRVLGTVFGLPLAVSEVVGGRPAPVAALRHDTRGFTDDVDRRFRFHLGGASRNTPESLGTGARIEFGIETEVQNVGRRDRPGTSAGWTREIAVTALDLSFGAQHGTITEWGALARLMPAAWHRREMHSTSDGAASGYSLLLGPSSTFELTMVGKEGLLYIRRIAAYTLGGSADLDVRGHAGRARLVVDAAGNFSNLTPSDYNYPRVQMAGESTVLLRRNYYHGAGVSGAARLTLGRGPLELDARAGQHRVWSLDTRDRTPDIASAVQPKRDHWTTAGVSLAWRINDGLEVAASRRQRCMWGSILPGHEFGDCERAWSARVAAAI